LRTESSGITPEEVIVLETVGPVDGFVAAVRNIEGLEWLGELDKEDIPADDDFFLEDRQGAVQPDRTTRGRLFLVFTNQQGLQQILSLWQAWLAGRTLPRGLRRWGEVFALLRDVRTWGVQDRLEETRILDDWRERVSHQQEVVPCELELWFRNDARRRASARERVVTLVAQLGGEVLQEAAIEEIAYHALLARLPIAAVTSFLDEAGHDAALVQCEQIQFFRASGQMAGSSVTISDSRIPHRRSLRLGISVNPSSRCSMACRCRTINDLRAVSSWTIPTTTSRSTLRSNDDTTRRWPR
jgi:hypothetical protein